MSRFTDKLREVADGGGQQPLGFARPNRDRTPNMLAIAALATAKADIVSAAVDAGADILILPGQDAKALDSLPDSVKNVPWGVSIESPAEGTIQTLKDKGCDFLVFPLAGTPLSVLRDEDLGKVLIIEPTIEERTARAVRQLPVDAILARVDTEGALTLEKLLEFAFIGALGGDYSLIDLPTAWTAGDLEELRDDGVTGIVVTFSDAKQGDDMRRLKEAIGGLAPRRKRDNSRARVTSLTLPGVDMHDHQEEEEEDDFDDD